MEKEREISSEKIDEAIAKAKARLKTKKNTSDTKENEPKVTRKRLSDEDRSAREALRNKERAEKRAEREAKREARRLARASLNKVAHVAKVQKAIDRLPRMSPALAERFNDIVSTFSPAETIVLAKHLEVRARWTRTVKANATALSEGQEVRITNGDPRFIGQIGTVTDVHRIRCYVRVPGVKRPVYLFTSDVEAVHAVTDEEDSAPADTAVNE